MKNIKTNVFYTLFYFISGAFALCFFSTLQKIANRGPIILTGYIVPFIIGGIFGTINGILHLRLNLSHKALEEYKDQLERLVEKRTSKLKQANHTLQRIAALDALTGIANRRTFDKLIKLEWRRAMRDRTPLSLIMCDIDHFKNYNDDFGHQQGDICLKSVANSIHKVLKRPGDFTARYGGEEFIIVLPNIFMEGASAIAEKIRGNIEALKIEHSDKIKSKYITISLGTATIIPKQSSVLKNLIETADNALYEAKAGGRNMVCTGNK